MTATWAPARLLLAAWFLAPLLGLVLWAVTDTWSGGSVLPDVWGLRGWTSTLDSGGTQAMLRSLALSCAVAAVATPVGAMAARGLVQASPRTRGWAAALLLSPVILPPLAVVLGLDVLLLRLGAPATLGVLGILVVQALPYTTYVMYATYLAYDDRYELEARTLGASTATVLRRVHIPLVAPGLAAALFLSLLVGWSDYVVTLVVGGGRLVTLPVLVAANAAGTGNEPAVAALSLAAVIPPLVLMTLAALVGRRARQSPAVS
jgi:putative spermidine/putrescine transport system permease protein